MRVLLLHNPEAGDEEHGREALVRAFKGPGHRVSYQSTKAKGWKERLDPSVDVFVVAGGDGTVRRVVLALAEKAIRRTSPSPSSRSEPPTTSPVRSAFPGALKTWPRGSSGAG
jgi:hypothetical protein